MKKIIFILTITSATIFASAQTPQAIPYQAVARDVNGNLITNQSISLRLSIVDQYIVPMTYYQETQTVSTNALGLFTVNVGQGTPVINFFADINWAGGFAKFLKVEMDVAGGTNYVNMGSSPLLSVPYSLYSAKSGNGMTDGSAFGSTMYWNGGGWDNNTNLYNAGQNIGIGTVNPATKLEVVGTTTTSNLAITGGASAGYVLQSDANGNASWTNPSTIIGPETDPQVSSATTNKVPKWNGTTLTDGSIFDDGKVGIGTTNPLTKLEVDGQVTIVDGNQAEGKVLTSDVNGTGRWAAPAGGDCFTHCQLFVNPNQYSFIVPSGVTVIKVIVQGGGAGGTCRPDNLGGGGGAGGYAEGIFTEVPGSAIIVTVGAGGLQNQNGGQSTFSDGVNNITALGGSTGLANLLLGGWGGDATGNAYLLMRGSSGGPASYGVNAQGGGGIGTNFGGGGGGIGGGNGSAFATQGFAQSGFPGSGGGGGGGGFVNSAYGNGGSGKVVIFW